MPIGVDAATSGISRRSFLKGTAAVGAVAASSGALQTLAPVKAYADEVPAEEMGTSFCRCNCGDGGCTFNLHVRNGNIAYVEPRYLADTVDLPDHGRSRACLRGLSNLGREYDPGRVLHPMRRVEGTERGAGQWEQITWDEALEEISTKWKSYVKDYGPASIANWTTFGNHASVHGETGVCWGRLIWFMGMSSLGTGADWSNMYATPQAIGANGIGPSMSAVEGNTKNFVCWGTNLAEAYPHVWRYIANAMEQGTVLTVVDPKLSMTAAKADNWFRVRPASDTALALGICRYYVDNDLVDREFLKANSDAPFLVRADTGKFLRSAEIGISVEESSPLNTVRHDQEYIVWDLATDSAVPADRAEDPALEGTFTVDGIEVTTVFSTFVKSLDEWTLPHTAEVCDISEEEIVRLADIINDGPTVLLTGFGFGHYANGHAMATSTCAVTILTGNLSKPGAGYGLSRLSGYATSNVYGAPATDPSITFKGGNGPTYSALKLPEIVKTGKYAGKDAVVKSAIVHSANPLGNMPGRTALLEALDGIDLLITVDMYMTDTALYSDIVLPCAFWFEVDDIYKSGMFPYVFYGPRAIEPLGESKSDFEICQLLAGAMGLGEYFQESSESVIRGMFDNSKSVDMNGQPIPFDRIAKEREVRLMGEDWYDARTFVYNTPTRRLNLYIENPKPRLDFGAPFDAEKFHLAFFEPPAEAWPVSAGGYEANPLAEKYPLLFQSSHCRWRTHTTFGNVEWLNELQGEPWMCINPEDAEARGIANGDYVRAFNDRGFVVVRARIDAAMRPGSVNLPHGWQKFQYVAGHYNDLTSGETEIFDANENYYDCLCEVEKYEVK